MYQLSAYFYKAPVTQNETKCNLYYDAFLDILTKRRDKCLSIYNIINAYSINTKKKIDDMLSEKNDITQAITKLKQHENVVSYFYCKDDKLYHLFEYSLTPTIRKNNIEIETNINETIDGYFAINVTVESIKDIIAEPKKYVNFDPKKITIKGSSILSQLIIFNEEKLLTDIIERYKIHITDNSIGMKYYDLLDLAIKTNNGNIVNILNRCYYEPKIDKMEKTISENSTGITATAHPYRKYYDYMIKLSPPINCILLPWIAYMLLFSTQCSS